MNDYFVKKLIEFPQRINNYLYVINNPINFYDLYGLYSCSTCAECPCGSWSGSGVNYGGFYFAVGFNTTDIDIKCNCSSVVKRVNVTCISFGVGLGGGISKIWGSVWGACNKSDIKWGGWEGGIGTSYLIIGSTVSGSGGIPQGSFFGGIGVGLGWNTSFYSKCYVNF